MRCEFFQSCGGCSLTLGYQEQLAHKIREFDQLGFTNKREVFMSPEMGYRSRAEFGIYRDSNGLHLSMYASKKPIIIHRCPILLPHLQKLLDALMQYLNLHLDFASKLFRVEVMGTLQEESLLTLIYHRNLNQAWEEEAKELALLLNVQLIGRSKGQKIILDKGYLIDSVFLDERKYHFIRYDNSFSQPNPFTNLKMLEFASSCIQEDARDLLELYCGGGNFTIPLSRKFKKVFATEVAKTSIKALQENLILNGIENIFCARLSGEESIQALSFHRAFHRLRDIDLKNYHFTHLLIDPPRSGIGDEVMLRFMQRFVSIIYISCNPLSLKKDLEILSQSHRITRLALFDQFPYTHHLECGVLLQKLL